jgi:hypothetical protein
MAPLMSMVGRGIILFAVCSLLITEKKEKKKRRETTLNASHCGTKPSKM